MTGTEAHSIGINSFDQIETMPSLMVFTLASVS